MEDTNIDNVMGMLEMKHNQKGEITGPRATLDNVSIILNNDIRFRGILVYDEVDMKICKSAPFPWDEFFVGPIPLDDVYDIAELQRVIQRDYYQRPEDVKAECTAVAMANRYNPIKIILEGLKWDGKEHVKNLMPKYLGVDDDEYQAKVLRLMLLALIERQYRPGAPFASVLALNGDQGLGKSTFCRNIALDDKYFTDALGDLTDKDTMQIVAGKRVIEFSEMLSLKKTKEQEAVKRFISATQDTFRPPYGRVYQDFPRQCIIIATTNDIDYLSDITGSRRWLPISCHAERVKDKTAIQTQEAKDEFLQAWLEEYDEWKKLTDNGKKALDLVSMSYELADEARERAQEHEETDPMEGSIELYLSRLENIDGWHRVCSKQIAVEALGIDRPTRFELKDISRIVDNRCKKWVRGEGKQRCGVYGPQRYWQCHGVGPDYNTKPEPEQTFCDLTDDDIDSYNNTLS